MVKKSALLTTWHDFLKIAFVYAIYHLIRDIFQDILGVHNAFTEFAHVEPDFKKIPSAFRWLSFGGFGRYITFPIEIFAIFAIPRALKNKSFTKLDFIMVLVLLLTIGIYVIDIIYAK